MFSTVRSVRRVHLDKTRFLIFGACDMMPSTASSVINEQEVRSSMRRWSKGLERTRGGRSS